MIEISYLLHFPICLNKQTTEAGSTLKMYVLGFAPIVAQKYAFRTKNAYFNAVLDPASGTRRHFKEKNLSEEVKTENPVKK